jgi:hypothetical protein
LERSTIALGAAVVILGLMASGSLLAQPVAPPYPAPYPAPYPGAYPAPYPGAFPGLPAYEIVAIVRSKGLEPLSRPMRQGPTYGLRAADASGRELHVLVDARVGRIIRVVPTARLGVMSPPYPVPPGRLVPDGNGPGSRIAGFPGPADEMPPDDRNPASAGTPGLPSGGPGPAGAASPRPAAKAPLPRPRPKPEASSAPALGASASANPAPVLVDIDE